MVANGHRPPGWLPTHLWQDRDGLEDLANLRHVLKVTFCARVTGPVEMLLDP
jgi:hypothetical protein